MEFQKVKTEFQRVILKHTQQSLTEVPKKYEIIKLWRKCSASPSLFWLKDVFVTAIKKISSFATKLQLIEIMNFASQLHIKHFQQSASV